MKTKVFFLIAVIFLTATVLKADDFKDAMIKAKKNLTEAINSMDEKQLLKVRGEYERILQLKTDEWLVNYFIAYVDYNLAYTGMSNGKNDIEKMKKYNTSAIEIINKSIEQKNDFSESHILKYGLNFNRYIYEMEKMMEIATTLAQLEQKIKAIDIDNPRFQYLLGASTYFTPENFGGGVTKAIPIFEKAVSLFATRIEKEEYYPDWGGDQAYGYLALAYKKLEQFDKAKEYFDKGKELYPNSGFLNYYIKSELEKK